MIAVNGRFLTMTTTGVQRYAREILRRIGSNLDSELRILVPPDRVFEGGDPALGEVETSIRWHGIDGHRWEQLVLPRLTRKTGAPVLWSPCSWGPVSARGHVPVVHDIAPLTLPQHFTLTYRALARALTGPLVRRAAVVVTPSTRVRGELLERFAVEPERVRVVAPGVGEPFNTAPLDDLDRRGRRYCLLIGAHASRKNAGFLIKLWPQVHARTGLELHLTYRRIVTTRRLRSLERTAGAGIVLHADPTDEQLLGLYADALCLLWPSCYEGYGFPLLEAMAVGTPFLSADVGAAGELALLPEEQILPLEPERWCQQIEAWQAADLSELRRASASRARAQTWDSTAEHMAQLLDRVAQSVPSRPS